MFFLKLFLYSLLGIVLSIIGISVMNNPVSFICILLIVLMIDIASTVAAHS